MLLVHGSAAFTPLHRTLFKRIPILEPFYMATLKRRERRAPVHRRHRSVLSFDLWTWILYKHSTALEGLSKHYVYRRPALMPGSALNAWYADVPNP